MNQTKIAKKLLKTGSQFPLYIHYAHTIFRNDMVKSVGTSVKLHCFALWWDVLDVCAETNTFDENTLNEMRAFLNNPCNDQQIMTVKMPLPE